MTTLIERLKNPEDHYEFSDPKKANAVLMSLCQEAADALAAPAQGQIESAKQIWREDQQRIAELSAEIDRLTAAQPASASWMEMVVANLVREGVNKHKARELAEHFYNLKEKNNG